MKLVARLRIYGSTETMVWYTKKANEKDNIMYTLAKNKS